MILLLFLFGILLASGLFFILADVLRLPYLSTAKKQRKNQPEVWKSI